MKHNRIIKREFSKQAPKFGDPGLTLSSQEILDWIVDRLPLDQKLLVLDVAAGTGHLSLAAAPHVKKVFALDLTREMLTVARKEKTNRSLKNVFLTEGNAETLPYRSGCFDLVLSRLAIHHFKRPGFQLQEMVRVCKPRHRVAVIDLLAPEDEGTANIYNRLEKLRDPSHVNALSKSMMENLLERSGIRTETFETRDVKVDFQSWVEMTGTKPENVEVLRNELMKDVNGEFVTGMRPFIEAGALKFLQVWSIFIGSKITTVKHAG